MATRRPSDPGRPEEGEDNTPDGEAGEPVISDEGFRPIRDILDETADMALELFEEAPKAISIDTRKKAGENLHRRLEIFKDWLLERAEEQFRAGLAPEAIRYNLKELMHKFQNNWIISRGDLDGAQKNYLDAPGKRLHFRVRVFAALCGEGKLGLKSHDKPPRGMEESKFIAHAKKRLGRYWGAYDRMCSVYDGGMVQRSLSHIVDGVVKELAPETGERSKRRALQRALLDKRIHDRVVAEIKDPYSVEMEKVAMHTWLEEGGDVALKFVIAPALWSINPLVGLGAWGLRGISESLGYDFGNVVRKLGKLPFKMAGGLSKGILKILPPSWIAKMPRGMQQWITKRAPPAFEKLGKVSLKGSERMSLLWRGMLPVPGLLNLIPYAKILVPDSTLEPGEAAQDEREEAEELIKPFCEAAMIDTPGKAVPPAPTTPPAAPPAGSPAPTPPPAAPPAAPPAGSPAPTTLDLDAPGGSDIFIYTIPR